MELQIKQQINASADKVWEVLAHQFAEIGEWSPRIEYSRALALNEVPAGLKVASNAPVPGRITPNPLGQLYEVLTEYSEDEKTFTFEVPGPAPLFSLTKNTTKVAALDVDKSLVTFNLDLLPKGIFKLFSPVIKRRFQISKFGPAGMIQDLKAYVENQ